MGDYIKVKKLMSFVLVMFLLLGLLPINVLATEAEKCDLVPLSQTITIRRGEFSDSTGEWLKSDIYGSIIGYELKKGHTLSLNHSDYVFAVRKLVDGNYHTLLRSASSANFTATEDMTVAIRVRKLDKSALTDAELASIRLYDTQYGMKDVPGFSYRFTVEAETINGGTATTRAAIFLPEIYSENGTPTRLIIMTNGRNGYLNDSVWNANKADDVGVMRHYMENGYAVLVVDNTAGTVNGAPDWGNPQLVDSYWKAYEYVQENFNVEELFSIHSRSMGTFAAMRMMRERPELVKCALMCGAVLSLHSFFDNDPAFVAQRYGFDDLTGSTWEADKVVGYDPYTDVNGIEYDLPPTFWMLSETDAYNLTTIKRIGNRGNDVSYKIYTETDHSGVCRLNIEACREDALAFLKKYQESSANHRFCAWQTTTQPTCGKPGEMRRYCADCDYYETIELSALPAHKLDENNMQCIICRILLVKKADILTLIPGHFYDSGEKQDSDIYGCVIGYSLKAGHTLSISDENYVFSVRILQNGNYSTMLKAATVDSFTADKDMTVAIRVRKPDKSIITAEELANIVLYDVYYAEHAHTYTPTVTAPTCTEQGYTTYTCACGDSYVDNYTDAAGHRFNSVICTICGKKYPDKITELDSALAVTITPENYLTISNPFTEKLACAPNLVTYGNGNFAVAYLADDVNTVETESSTTIVCRLGLFDVNAPDNGSFFDIATAGQKIGDVTIGNKAPYEPNLLKLGDDALLVLFNIRDTAGNYVYYSARFDTASNTVTSYQPLTLDGKNWTPVNIAVSYNALAEHEISTSGPTGSMVFTSKIIQHEGYYYGYCGGICSGFSGMLVRSTDGIHWTSVMAPEALPEMAGVIECGFEFLEDYVYFCMRDISSGVYHCSYDFKTGEQLTKTLKLSGITTSKPTAFTQDGNLYLIVNKATGDDNTVGRRNTALFYRVNPKTCRLTLVREVFCADGVAYHSIVNHNGINYWSFHTDARRINPYTQGRSNLAFLQIPELYVSEVGSADGVLDLNDYGHMFARGCITVASNTWQAGAVNMHYQIPMADFENFDTVTITANGEQKTYIAFFTDRMTQNGVIAYAEGWTEQLIMEPGTVQTLIIPEDAAYLYILNNNAAGANLLPQRVVFGRNDQPAPSLAGDLNLDGSINTTDVVLLRRYIAGGYGVSIHEAAADVNADGVLNTSDVVLLRRYIAGGYGVELASGRIGN